MKSRRLLGTDWIYMGTVPLPSPDPVPSLFGPQGDGGPTPHT